MQLVQLLARPGLPASDRILIALGVAIWRGDWSGLDACTMLARSRGHDRDALDEVLLQSILFCGFPRVVTAFERLTRAWPRDGDAAPGGLPRDRQAAAGSELFRTIYGRNDATVRAMLQSYHPELHDFVFEAAYGRVLTRPGLSGRQRELIAVGTLAAQEQHKQLVAHGRGALHLGATRDEVREALITACGDERRAEDLFGQWLQRM